MTQTPEYQALERELAESKNADARNAQLESEIARLQSEDSSLLPSNPKPGECYARVVIPAKYQTVSETVQTVDPSERIDVTPPEYRWVEKQERHKEASTRLEIVPATYKDVTETIQLSEPSEKLERVPATYKTVIERILVSPARTEWKKRTKTADSYLEWRSILCETNTTPDLISRLQTALNDKGHNPGPIDSVYGVETQGQSPATRNPRD